jgi:hypothetical protein
VVTVTVTAHCIGRCAWTVSGAWADTDRAADRHTRTAGHPTATVASATVSLASTEGNRRAPGVHNTQ